MRSGDFAEKPFSGRQKCLESTYVGPVELTFENRSCFVGALVFAVEVLLLKREATNGDWL